MALLSTAQGDPTGRYQLAAVVIFFVLHVYRVQGALENRRKICRRFGSPVMKYIPETFLER